MLRKKWIKSLLSLSLSHKSLNVNTDWQFFTIYIRSQVEKLNWTFLAKRKYLYLCFSRILGLGIDKARFDFDTSLTNDSPYPVLENIAVRCWETETEGERTLKMDRQGSFISLQSIYLASGFGNLPTHLMQQILFFVKNKKPLQGMAPTHLLSSRKKIPLKLEPRSKNMKSMFWLGFSDPTCLILGEMLTQRGGRAGCLL